VPPSTTTTNPVAAVTTTPSRPAGTGSTTTVVTSTAQRFGDDPHLDSLQGACGLGDYASCDRLYYESPTGSDYEDYGDTCGNRTSAGGALCTEQLG
jgi:hypothetical protein